MRFLSIKDAAALIGKSESSIKRFVNQVKVKEPDKYRNPVFFKFERMSNGNDKILISEAYLLVRFTSSKNEPHDLISDPLYSSENTNKPNSSNGSKNEPHDLVEFLKAQLIEKDKQIESLLSRIESLLDRNKEINLLFAQAQQREQIKLEESIPKKRWWQWKKEN